MDKLIRACVEILDLKKPYVIKYRFLKNQHAAEYIEHYLTTKPVKHEIRIDPRKGAGRHRATLIAHEFIHAWQAEQDRRDMHGPWFKQKAEHLSVELAHMGIFLKGRIYDPDCDK